MLAIKTRHVMTVTFITCIIRHSSGSQVARSPPSEEPTAMFRTSSHIAQPENKAYNTHSTSHNNVTTITIHTLLRNLHSSPSNSLTTRPGRVAGSSCVFCLRRGCWRSCRLRARAGQRRVTERVKDTLSVLGVPDEPPSIPSAHRRLGDVDHVLRGRINHLSLWENGRKSDIPRRSRSLDRLWRSSDHRANLSRSPPC